MLKLSKLSDYASIILAYIANQKKLVSCEEVSTANNISFSTSSKLLKQLAKHNLLISKKGSKGGYRFEKDVNEISMLDIVTAIDGPVHLADCIKQETGCSKSKNCTIKNTVSLINKSILDLLKSVTVKNLIEGNKLIP